MQVRELIEMLERFPKEMRLAFVLELSDTADAGNAEILRREDVVELKISAGLRWKSESAAQ